MQMNMSFAKIQALCQAYFDNVFHVDNGFVTTLKVNQYQEIQMHEYTFEFSVF